MSFELTYETYLRLPEILDAQRPPDHAGALRDLAHHDELLFIVTHQAYELWFKQVIHEMERARDLLAQDPVPEPAVTRVCRALQRVHEIQKVMIAQLGVLETMNPVDFLAFRDLLGSSSGFQSAQFRMLEILAGLPDEKRYQYQGDSFERRFSKETVARFDELRAQTNLREALDAWLARTPVEEGFLDAYLDAFDGYVDGQVAMHGANDQLTDEERARALKQLEGYRAACRTFLTGDRARVLHLLR